eukprot:TRINITY_DN39946_c0_g1_i1.p1 TRINITY_DN39946_c0_g1~~TRINITY_DN39946_c0_g1_i1.p1  ORF type:complete len:625 (+),score=124.63 TRINITY_DN39946_c0_g1_i1:64-1875(+)
MSEPGRSVVFRDEEVELPWDTVWERLAEVHGRDPPHNIRRLIRYLCQREGLKDLSGRVVQSSTVGRRMDWDPFVRYFPEKTMLDHVHMLNAHRCFWLGAGTNDIKNKMEPVQETAYAGRDSTTAAAAKYYRAEKRCTAGSFILRPSSSQAGCICVSYVRPAVQGELERLLHSFIEPSSDGLLDITGLPEQDGHGRSIIVTRAPAEARRSLHDMVLWLLHHSGSVCLQKPCGFVVRPPPPVPTPHVSLLREEEHYRRLKEGLNTLARAAVGGGDLSEGREVWEQQRLELEEWLQKERSQVAALTADGQETRYALQAIYRKEIKRLLPAYKDQMRRIEFRNVVQWGELSDLAKRAGEEFTGPVVQQLDDGSPLVQLYAQAGSVFADFRVWLTEVGAQSAKYVDLCEHLKCPFRAVEKAVLADEPRRQSLACVADVVRGMLVFEDCGGMLNAFRTVLSSDAFEVSRVKDRLGQPTNAGWSDILVNGHLRSDKCRHQCEVQLVFDRMRTVRHKLGGHEDYVAYRRPYELLMASGYQPDEDMRPTDLRRAAAAARERGDEAEASMLEDRVVRLEPLLRQDRGGVGNMKTDDIEPVPWHAPDDDGADQH